MVNATSRATAEREDRRVIGSRMGRRGVGGSAGLAAWLMAAAVLVTGNRAGADTVYASTGTGNMIDTVNTATGTVTPLFTVTNGPPDDLITDGPGSILYLAQANSVAGAGQLRMYNLN